MGALTQPPALIIMGWWFLFFFQLWSAHNNIKVINLTVQYEHAVVWDCPPWPGSGEGDGLVPCPYPWGKGVGRPLSVIAAAALVCLSVSRM